MGLQPTTYNLQRMCRHQAWARAVEQTENMSAYVAALSLFAFATTSHLFGGDAFVARPPIASRPPSTSIDRHRLTGYLDRDTAVSLNSTIDDKSITEIDDNRNVGVDVADRVHPSVALVIPVGVRNMTSRGSGFAIDGSKYDLDDDSRFVYLVTAAHVAAPGYEICLSFPGVGGAIGGGDSSANESIPATVVARNGTLDLALLRIDASSVGRVPRLTIARELPRTGAAAFSHGYPACRLRHGPAITSGVVCGIADGLGLPGDENEEIIGNGDTTTYVVTDAAMSGGMSGGPLTDASGDVLGVNALIRPDLRALGNYAVSSEEVLAFLGAVRSIQRGENVETCSATLFEVTLYNDRMNKKERVSEILMGVVGMNAESAEDVMMKAHKTGRGIVRSFDNQDEADKLCLALKRKDLLVEVQQQQNR